MIVINSADSYCDRERCTSRNDVRARLAHFNGLEQVVVVCTSIEHYYYYIFMV